MLGFKAPRSAARVPGKLKVEARRQHFAAHAARVKARGFSLEFVEI
jgi:hypothetical protein